MCTSIEGVQYGDIEVSVFCVGPDAPFFRFQIPENRCSCHPDRDDQGWVDVLSHAIFFWASFCLLETLQGFPCCLLLLCSVVIGCLPLIRKTCPYTGLHLSTPFLVGAQTCSLW